MVSGSANIRVLNRSMRWMLPADGAKTINGLLLEELETIPEAGTSVQIGGYPITILRTSDNAVQTVRIGQRLASDEEDAADA